MKTDGIRGYIVIAIIMVVFNVITWVAPFDKTGTFFAGYIFGIVAIAFQVYFLRVSFLKGEDVKSKFYGFPIAKIGVVYLGAQLALSLVQMMTARVFPVRLAVIVNVIILAVAAVGCIAAEVMRDEIARQDVQLKKDVTNMRELQSLTNSLPGICQEEELKKSLTELAEEFRYSDPVSSDSTTGAEEELKVLVREIQKALIDGDNAAAKTLCARVKSGLGERNRLCKVGK